VKDLLSSQPINEGEETLKIQKVEITQVVEQISHSHSRQTPILK